jgi:hypothetical protein
MACMRDSGANHMEKVMIEANKMRYLRIVLFAVGLIFVVGLYPLTIFLPSGYSWHEPLSEQMLFGVYATLGVFLIIASRNPLAHRSLIWFTVWSSVVHGGIMAVQAVVYPQHIGHILGDVQGLLVVAAVIAYLMPRPSEAQGQPRGV